MRLRESATVLSRGRTPLPPDPPGEAGQAVPAGNRNWPGCSAAGRNHIASVAIGRFGGCGFAREYPMEKFYRDGMRNLQLQTMVRNLTY